MTLRLVVLLIVFWASAQVTTTSASSSSRRTIVGGTVAESTRYPYFVRLEYYGDLGCGGTLVWPDFVLTAAHCTEAVRSSIVAVLGTNDNNHDEQRRSIRRIQLHPSYDDPTREYDMALLQLDEPVMDTPVIQLANVNHHEWWSSLEQQPLYNLTVLGWGATTDRGFNSDVLRQAELKVVPDEECELAYIYDEVHPPSMLCAASNDYPGPCFRDSGGPLILLGKNQPNIGAASNDSPANNNDTVDTNNETANYINETTRPDLQVGIVSFGGEVCADPQQPSVYADAAIIQSWVDNVICSYSVVTPSTTRCPNGVGNNDNDKVPPGKDGDETDGSTGGPSSSALLEWRGHWYACVVLTLWICRALYEF